MTKKKHVKAGDMRVKRNKKYWNYSYFVMLLSRFFFKLLLSKSFIFN